MAKVGNEAKLILSLAEEKSESARIKTVRNTEFQEEYRSGYASGILDYTIILRKIVRELETVI